MDIPDSNPEPEKRDVGASMPDSSAPAAGQPKISLREIFLTFLAIGATSFGGGVVAYLRSSLVEKKQWLNDDSFLEVLEISQTLPGLNATNMAVLVGDKLRGWPGAVAGFLGMLLPGATLILILGIVYASNAHNETLNAVLKGVGAASVGLLLAVTLQIGRRQLEHRLDVAIVAVTLVLVSFVHVMLPIVLLTVGPIAIFLYRPRTHLPHKADDHTYDKRSTD
jgi:Chromate transport protein ChrA